MTKNMLLRVLFVVLVLASHGVSASDTEVVSSPASRKLLDKKSAAEYVGLQIRQDKAILSLGAKDDIKLWRNGQSSLKIEAGKVDFVSDSVTVNGKSDFDYVPLSHNLISNSFMSHLSGKKPAGFRVSSYACSGCKMTIEAVSAFTKCFEGPYCPAKNKKCSKYPKAVSKCDDATGSKPYIFGTYYKGPRASRGGLADGWAGGGGRILKITGVRPKGAKYVIRINFPLEKKTLTNKVLFRGWLKIIKGSASLQTDVGVRPIWTRAITSKAKDGWFQINRKISGSHVTDLDGSHTFTFCAYGEESGHYGKFEMYLALPYITNILEKTSNHDKDGTTHVARWQDSVMDQVIDHGLARWNGDKIANQEAKADFDWVPLSHNLISNSFMSHLTGKKPAGFRVSSYACSGCKMTLEAVSAFTKCFEGPYCNYINGKCNNYKNAVKKCNDATGSRPYIFGRYYKGPRASRGGLADGWAGGGGRILKITGVRPKQAKYVIRVNFPIEKRTLTNQVLFRGWLKIIKGGASLQTDVGPHTLWTRAMTSKAKDGWYQINRKVRGSHVTDLDGIHTFAFCVYGEESGLKGNFEMYLALPYMANVLDKIKGINSDNHAHIARWQDSVMDQVVYHGVAKWNGDNIGPTRRRLGEEDFEVATLREQVSVLQKQNQEQMKQNKEQMKQNKEQMKQLDDLRKEQMKQLNDLRKQVAEIALKQKQ